MTTGNRIVDEVSEMNIGHIPDAWYKNIRRAGQPNLLAIILLSDIVYWYKWTEVRDEYSGMLVGVKKKFKYDFLQRNYPQIQERYGVSKRIAINAVNDLCEIGVIKKHLRTIQTKSGVKLSNVLFIELVPSVLRQISFISNLPEIKYESEETTIVEETDNNNDTVLFDIQKNNTPNSTYPSTKNDTSLCQNGDTLVLKTTYPSAENDTRVCQNQHKDMSKSTLPYAENGTTNTINTTINTTTTKTITSTNLEISNLGISAMPFPDNIPFSLGTPTEFPANIPNESIEIIQEEPKPKKRSVSKTKKTFLQSDYDECVNIFENNKEYLLNKGLEVDLTDYSPALIRKLLKSAFTRYGTDETKNGLRNSVDYDWLISIGYPLNAIFSDKVFPKCVSGNFDNCYNASYAPKNNYNNYAPRKSSGPAFDPSAEYDYSEGL